MRRKDETMRDTILELAKEILNTEGLSSINIRNIAKKAGIATGTLYNYFSNKDEILIALTEDYWDKTLKEMTSEIGAQRFDEQLENIYSYLISHISRSAGILMSSLRNIEPTGRKKMQSMHIKLEAILLYNLENDPYIRKDIWDDYFTREKYASFIIKNLLLNLQNKESDISFLIEIVKKTLY